VEPRDFGVENPMFFLSMTIALREKR